MCRVIYVSPFPNYVALTIVKMSRPQQDTGSELKVENIQRKECMYAEHAQIFPLSLFPRQYRTAAIYNFYALMVSTGDLGVI